MAISEYPSQVGVKESYMGGGIGPIRKGGEGRGGESDFIETDTWINDAVPIG